MKQSDCQAWTITRPCNFHDQKFGVRTQRDKFFHLPLFTFFSVPWFLCGFIDFHWYTKRLRRRAAETVRTVWTFWTPGTSCQRFRWFQHVSTCFNGSTRCGKKLQRGWNVTAMVSTDAVEWCLGMFRSYCTMLHIHELKWKLSIGQDDSSKLPFYRKQSIAIQYFVWQAAVKNTVQLEQFGHF